MLRAEKSLGTLGGGNHFIEADKDEEGNIYIVIHSGQPTFGTRGCQLLSKEGYHQLNGSSKADIDALIGQLKVEGRNKEIQKSVAALKM